MKLPVVSNPVTFPQALKLASVVLEARHARTRDVDRLGESVLFETWGQRELRHGKTSPFVNVNLVNGRQSRAAIRPSCPSDMG